MLLQIIRYPDPRLTKRAVPVITVDDKVRQILDWMAETLYATRGVGLAGPQVGVPLRLFVADVGDGQLLKVINPELSEASGVVTEEEACLSVPGARGRVTRPARVLLEGTNEHGEPLRIDARGLLARVVSHECDHLNGKLFIDHLGRLARQFAEKEAKRYGAGVR